MSSLAYTSALHSLDPVMESMTRNVPPERITMMFAADEDDASPVLAVAGDVDAIVIPNASDDENDDDDDDGVVAVAVLVVADPTLIFLTSTRGLVDSRSYSYKRHLSSTVECSSA